LLRSYSPLLTEETSVSSVPGKVVLVAVGSSQMRAMAALGCGERVETHMELVADDLEIARGGEGFAEQAARFVLRTGA
jgi:hypothetical protein